MDRYVSHGGPASTWHIVREWSPLTRCGRRVVGHEDQWPKRSTMWKGPRCRSCIRLIEVDSCRDHGVGYEGIHGLGCACLDPPA